MQKPYICGHFGKIAKKCKKPQILGIFNHFGPKCPILEMFWPKMVNFLVFLEKTTNITFLHSLRLTFMQKIRKNRCAVFYKNDYTTDRETDETVFNGPNCLMGIRPKKIENA